MEDHCLLEVLIDVQASFSVFIYFAIKFAIFSVGNDQVFWAHALDADLLSYSNLKVAYGHIFGDGDIECH